MTTSDTRQKSALLVDAKKETQDDVLAKTVAAFAETDTFVQRTVNSTRLQESSLGQLTPEEQKKSVKSVQVKASKKKGGLVFITAENIDEEKAKIVNNESTETLVRMTRLYIGDDKEVAIKAIDQAIITKGLVDKKEYIAKTVAMTVLLFLILVSLEPLWKKLAGLKQTAKDLRHKMKRHEKKEEAPNLPDERFVPQKLDPAFLYPESAEPVAQASQPKASEVLKAEVYGKKEEPAQKTPLQSVSVSMDDLPFTFETPTEEVTLSAQPVKEAENIAPTVAESLPPDQEPTVLEYKRRLNELLSQK